MDDILNGFGYSTRLLSPIKPIEVLVVFLDAEFLDAAAVQPLGGWLLEDEGFDIDFGVLGGDGLDPLVGDLDGSEVGIGLVHKAGWARYRFGGGMSRSCLVNLLVWS